ncbi:MAG: carboxypeptidase [Candidatus Wallbacteria bacterium HGW-Wallbacteria-1]|jgi:carboxypeptidase Taq|uniref:Metal-dependent carboxypeptidase n=1 Tax=Candidatus Wallbacteria bacterium HGW-Wallbacteria-1 TaxID=2013854 RepID=A0A2N1PRZ0_9BACT|nr:MAG: carboxypeptidase [Candidatus Wallbacteria bacterium HGW-Wallbacteria-1]
MIKKFERLRELTTEINNLSRVAAILNWDQATYMPRGGGAARARQKAFLERLAHERLTSSEMGDLLNSLRDWAGKLPKHSMEASLVRITDKAFKLQSEIPAEFQERFSMHISETYEAWQEARNKNNYSIILPYLRKSVDLSREASSYSKNFSHVADPLIDRLDEGYTAAGIRKLFTELRKSLVPMLKAISEKPSPDTGPLFRTFPAQKQWDFGLKTIEKIGFDFSRGRQDLSEHPFTDSFSVSDVRITTRLREDDFQECFTSTLHEAGHGFYEQGFNPLHDGTPLAAAPSMGIHESQSRLWENMIGKSRNFWLHFFPLLQEYFPSQTEDLNPEKLYRSLNRVSPSLIRTEADEVSYDLHIMIRFELELALLEGSISVEELPDAWNELYMENLGIEVSSDSNGVLQDMHWYSDFVGGVFQCYTLGNIMAAQLYQAALRDIPEIPHQISMGNFSPIFNWMRDKVHAPGSTMTAEEIIVSATGSPLCAQPYIAYLTEKYSDIYSL